MAQSTIAATTQASHGWKSMRRTASQNPNPIAPRRPTIVAAFPTIAIRFRLRVVSAVLAERSETMTIHDITSEPTSSAALRTWRANIQASKSI